MIKWIDWKDGIGWIDKAHWLKVFHLYAFLDSFIDMILDKL